MPSSSICPYFQSLLWSYIPFSCASCISSEYLAAQQHYQSLSQSTQLVPQCTASSSNQTTLPGQVKIDWCYVGWKSVHSSSPRSTVMQYVSWQWEWASSN